MAWRLAEYFIEGVLDNSTNNKVTGWMQFAGMNEKVTLELEGNFHRDIRGAKIRLRGEGAITNPQQARAYMQRFSPMQKGRAGDITGGFPPADYISGSGYVEWYSVDSGRCVLTLTQDQIEILSPPIPVCESEPIDRDAQARNMAEFLEEVAQEVGILPERAIVTDETVRVERAKKVMANDRIRGMQLLPQEIRDTLPPLYSQDGKGGKAIAYVRLFTPDSAFTWWITEAGPITNEQGQVIDHHLFGLVEGHCRELGYVSLHELEEVRGPMGLPVERDLWFKPTALEKIAPEMFREEANK